MFFLWKNIGETPLACLNRFRKSFPEYADETLSYAGRLDPIAEGVLLIIEGAENQERERYLGVDKTYVAEIIVGIETDTYDVLGIPQQGKPVDVSDKEMRGSVEKLRGVHILPYPPYSSKTVSGKPLWQWAREGKLDTITIPKRAMEVRDVSVVSIHSHAPDVLKERIAYRVNLVSGDFRQNEIIAAWQEFLAHTNEPLRCIYVSFSVCSGVYIRSLAHTLGELLGTKATLLHLARTSVATQELTK